jgi:polyhydroxyalkanoate synthesis regulator phasin
MSFTFEKVAELEYNELVSLYLIETDELLKEIFVDKVKTPFNLLYKFIKDGGEMMSTETKEVIFELFDKIISTRENLAERYQHLQKNDYINQVLEKKNIVEPKVDVEKVIFKTESYKVKHDKPVEKSVPRRYGKDKILKDIKEQGTPATSLQRAMIDLNDVRNLYVKLSDRAIKDMFGGTENFTEEDCRKITAVVKTFKQQVESIINKKK